MLTQPALTCVLTTVAVVVCACSVPESVAPARRLSASGLPEPTQLNELRRRGGKLFVYHGTSDPVFSSDDTAVWYEGVRAANGRDTPEFARYYPVPGMNHRRGVPQPTSSTNGPGAGSHPAPLSLSADCGVQRRGS